MFTGPPFPLLEHKAFETAAEIAGDQPESVPYIGQQEYSKDATRDRWRDHGPSACLSIRIFDDVVSECYERGQYKDRVTLTYESTVDELSAERSLETSILEQSRNCWI